MGMHHCRQSFDRVTGELKMEIKRLKSESFKKKEKSCGLSVDNRENDQLRMILEARDHLAQGKELDKMLSKL